jgi:hypothetical protein
MAFLRSNHFGSRPRTACCAIAILEVARELLFAPIRLWQSLEDDFRAAAPAFGGRSRMA